MLSDRGPGSCGACCVYHVSYCKAFVSGLKTSVFNYRRCSLSIRIFISTHFSSRTPALSQAGEGGGGGGSSIGPAGKKEEHLLGGRGINGERGNKMEPAGETKIERMRCLLISLRRIPGAHVLGGFAYRCPSSIPFILPASTVLLRQRQRRE